MAYQNGGFDRDRAVADIEVLLARPVPADGPTESEYDPLSGERTGTAGEGFVLARLWASRWLDDVSVDEWHAEVAGGDLKALDLTAELTRRWGPARQIAMHPAMFRHQAGEPLPPVFQALCDADDFGDLTVWGPVPAGPAGAERWVGISVGHGDDKAPLVLTAVVTDRDIVELDDPL
ncbi:hypothetical protein BJP40_22595 [Streptomyces sp. CC53]|uniref:hypothetical protein n=1 Tax=unclassified Streptomyces TaxID=2593676 RepID=UPI0008DCEE17|nr:MULTISPECIES: hypothetical protein [unclassified Streptomyces]OII63863.1 hypothetical protein BJP40_22595 [Streptomyces sp. CC53]